MDLATQLRLTRELLDIDSTSGREGEAGAWPRQDPAPARVPGRRTAGQPRIGSTSSPRLGSSPDVVFSTHFDCVPPFFPSREEQAAHPRSRRLRCQGDGDRAGGGCRTVARGGDLPSGSALRRRRGARQRRREAGEHDCARVARISSMANRRTTGWRVATRGLYRTRSRTRGRAAHSSQPELGESAIEKLVDALVALRRCPWPSDPELGRRTTPLASSKGASRRT